MTSPLPIYAALAAQDDDYDPGDRIVGACVSAPPGVATSFSGKVVLASDAFLVEPVNLDFDGA